MLGVGVSITSPENAAETVARWIAEGERNYVCVANVHMVMECQRDAELRRIHNASGLTVPDGRPLSLCGHVARAHGMRQTRGADLMTTVLERAAREGWRSYFLGGAQGTPQLLARRLAQRFPGLRVVGTRSPPFRRLTALEEDEIVGEINASDADLVWVGLSAPKQERWMATHREKLDAPVLLGVGAAFDFLAGLKPQAPIWVQRLGFEWLFRLALQPKRMWRRYIVNNPEFVLRVIMRPPRLMDGTAERRGGGDHVA